MIFKLQGETMKCPVDEKHITIEHKSKEMSYWKCLDCGTFCGMKKL